MKFMKSLCFGKRTGQILAAITCIHYRPQYLVCLGTTLVLYWVVLTHSNRKLPISTGINMFSDVVEFGVHKLCTVKIASNLDCFCSLAKRYVMYSV